ncbi:sodium:proton antiporter [Parashewanella spongiae]|uniref:Sodium:proton antiporter n=1 Tax=Parashewanella spongiae TaxID=342950 RepID=A0A3A6TQ93_9GAMM|nr:sodium:proton antiporter NhaD [Parashewanella spongiae]MCL1078658.1 sodium:proton antiporter NhaD [Parashewanella spongiae]RJY16307.1 sodium:proton antiporter [Parashewanella spongiae]
MLNTFLIILSIIALLSIIFEDLTHINKAKTTLFLGCLSWVFLFVAASDPNQTKLIDNQLNDNLLEIATLWLFLMSTMTFVAYLNAKGMIQVIVQKIFPSKVSVRILMIQVAMFALILSTFCDNVTATLVTLGLLSTFELSSEIKLKMTVLVIFAVNSGGVALITGDVTTLMIFLSGHVQMSELLSLLIPSAISVIFLSFMFSYNAKGTVTTQEVTRNYQKVDVAIAVLFLTTIIMTMILNIVFAIPPVLTFLSGLSLMFLIGTFARSEKEEVQVLEYVRQVEFETLLFFLGILLLVGMLKQIGVLDMLANVYGIYNPDVSNFFTGMASALLDNVPMTAALLKADPTLSLSEWMGLTYSVGVGGSLLVIGSAAGIIAMSKVKELTFGSYLKYFPALFICYSLGYGLTIIIGQQLFS